MKLASPIHLLERDYFLQFDRQLDVWPPADLDILKVTVADEKSKAGIWMAGPWERHILESGGYLSRTLEREPRENDPPHRHKTALHEAMIRFPSAPLFGSQSKTGFQVKMTPFQQHTLRLLRSTDRTEVPVTKIFLLFNGLNELDHLGFYYELAGLLMNDAREDANVACLIVPFPAHLMRYPLIGKYAEKPLQRFISDPSDLFRQYLRFMVETQWLISALASIPDYPVTSGIPLVRPHSEIERSRCNPEILGRAIHGMWQTIFKYSKRYSERPSSEVSENDILQSIHVLRTLIGWSPCRAPLSEGDERTPLGTAQIHVIGYSLGGYLAQSVFFSWPYAIGSCTTLCSGGALTGLRPEKIIHEEEWRAITHGLQYDIESGMLEDRIAADDPKNPTSICGVPVSTFTSHFQTFTDIFLQDPYGTYRHRVSEFAPRLFFVVGGNDPIVPTRSVLETSPPEGINLIEIAKLSHFIATERGEWPDFWLPTIANIISSLSDHSEHLLWRTTLSNFSESDTVKAVERDPNYETMEKHTAKFLRDANPDRRDPQPLNSEEIQDTILDFVKRLKDKEGFLLVLRNQIPVTLMGPKVLQRRGAIPHYGDLEINKYWQFLQLQRLGMLKAADRVAIVVPGQLNKWFVERAPTLSFKPLVIVEEFPDHQVRQEEIWKRFLDDWEATAALYRFDAQPAKVSGEGFRLENLIRDATAQPAGDFWILNCLPDTWISFSRDVVSNLAGRGKRTEILSELRRTMLHAYTGRGKNEGERTIEEKQALSDLDRWLEQKAEDKHRQLQVLRISAAQSSPRYLGELIHSRSVAVDILTHTALALARSTQCFEKGDFAKGWQTGPLTATQSPTLPRIEIARSAPEETVKQFGKFTVKEIGRGAMAVIYEAMKNNRLIAIKRMSDEALADPDNRKRFDEEAKVSLALNHPNIVQTFRYDETEGIPYLEMERLHGEPLKAAIDAHRRFAPLDTARLAIQITQALDYTHRSHVVHRDLKPGNIMLIDGGRKAKIMDYGIAVTPDTDRLTKTGMCIGTPHYMSPDRLAGYEATEASDLYALGLILYEMLTGQYAVEERLRIKEEHPRASAIVRDVPAALDDIVAKLLARDPDTGYKSASELLADLKMFVGPED